MKWNRGMTKGNNRSLNIAMLSVHSSPLGELGSRDTGGMSVYVRELACELGKAGHRVDIFTCLRGEQRESELLISENVRLLFLSIGKRLNISKESLYAYLPSFFDSLEEHRVHNGIRYDLIHSHYWLSGQVGCMAQHRWNVPHIMMFHTTGTAKKANCSEEEESPLRLVVEKKLAHECDRILSPTEKERNMITRSFSIPEKKIGLVPCGVNLETFRPMDKNIAREALGLSEFGPIILYVGRFAPVKGIDRLLAALPHLKKYDGLRLVIAGGDGLREDSALRLRHSAQKYGVLNKVLFTGRVEHEKLAAYYSAADVLAVPSYYESFGMVALESLACGTPVAAARVGAMESLVQSGKTGELFFAETPQGIAGVLGKVIELQQKGAFSQNEVRSFVIEYAWPDIASAVLREYLKTIHSSMKIQGQRKVVHGN